MLAGQRDRAGRDGPAVLDSQRTLARNVRRAAGDTSAQPTSTKRSTTLRWSNTAASASNPTDNPNAARRAAAHNNAFALVALGGAAAATTLRAKPPASGGICRGR